MRCMQWVGLNERAKALVAGEQALAYTERVTRVYPDGREEPQPDRPVMVSSVQCEELNDEDFVVSDPFGGDDTPLHQYRFPDGRVLTEAVQDEPWSSGPVVFLAFKDASGTWVPESLWTEAEIQANT